MVGSGPGKVQTLSTHGKDGSMVRNRASSRTVIASLGVLFLLGMGPALFLANEGAAADKVGPQKHAPIVPPKEGKSETIKLFNATDLDGRVGPSHLWSLKDGIILAKNPDPINPSPYPLTQRKLTHSPL